MKRMILSILAVFVVLFGTSFALNETAYANYQKEHLQLLQTLLPGTTDFVLVPYDGEDANIRSVHKNEKGYVVETVTRGYADDIRMYVAVDFDGDVMGLVVLEAHETYGLGSRILTDHVFLSQFLNGNGSFAAATADAFSGATGEAETGDETQVDAISGATVSSKAVLAGVNTALQALSQMNLIGGEAE